MRNSIKILFPDIIAFILLIASCSKDDGPEQKSEPEVVLSSDKEITSFVFLLTNNSIDTNVVGAR